MKNKEEKNTLFAEERQEKIISMLETQSKIYVSDLCSIFGVSPATIRNDLRDLDEQGRLKRTHGGALSCRNAGFEQSSERKETRNQREKKRIAECAAGYVEEGDIVALDAGTTTLEMVPFLKEKKNITIVTNDAKIMLALENECNCQIIFIGGIVRRGLSCTAGPVAINEISLLQVDKVFMAANAFSVEKGFTTPDMNTAEVKKRWIGSARRVFMLCDSSKVGNISFVKFASLKDIDVLIADRPIDKKIIGIIKNTKPELKIEEV